MDLRTQYLGLELKHPIVASASPLSKTLDGIKRMEDAGASAIVLFSLFEEQIRADNEAFDYLSEAGTESFAESLSYFPAVEDYRIGPDSYLELIRQATAACSVPIIASINGVTNSGWTEYSQLMVEAGAKAIELNIFHIPADITISGRDVEQRYVDVVARVRAAVKAQLAAPADRDALTGDGDRSLIGAATREVSQRNRERVHDGCQDRPQRDEFAEGHQMRLSISLTRRCARADDAVEVAAIRSPLGQADEYVGVAFSRMLRDAFEECGRHFLQKHRDGGLRHHDKARLTRGAHHRVVKLQGRHDLFGLQTQVVFCQVTDCGTLVDQWMGCFKEGCH